MRRDFARLRNRNRFGQKESAPIACIADPLGNARAPDEPCSVESVLQQKRSIYVARPVFDTVDDMTEILERVLKQQSEESDEEEEQT